ncbi:hypothetical protein ACF1BE_29765 [Streptomyces sp. NPDC014991]
MVRAPQRRRARPGGRGTRDTAYTDLRARGIEPTDKDVPDSHTPQYWPLT